MYVLHTGLVVYEIVGLDHLADIVVVGAHPGEERVGSHHLGRPLGQVAYNQRVVVGARASRMSLRKTGWSGEQALISWRGGDAEQGAQHREGGRRRRPPPAYERASSANVSSSVPSTGVPTSKRKDRAVRKEASAMKAPATANELTFSTRVRLNMPGEPDEE